MDEALYMGFQPRWYYHPSLVLGGIKRHCHGYCVKLSRYEYLHIK